MKKSLIAISLSLALMPGFVYSATTENRKAVEVKINGQDVSQLSNFFSGEALEEQTAPVLDLLSEQGERSAIEPNSMISEVASQNVASSISKGIETKDIEVGDAVITMTIADTPHHLESSEETVIPEIPISQLQSQHMEVDNLTIVDGAGLLENYQKFRQVEIPDYRHKASYWADKAPKASEVYAYKTRLSSKDQARFKEIYLDLIDSGKIKEIVLVHQKGLTPQGEFLYQALLASEGEGLIPSLYHVGRIENLLQSGEIGQHQAEIRTLLHDGGLSYIRDMVLGMPEIKRKDSEWLLEGRSIDVSNAMVEVLQSSSPKDALNALAPQYPQYQSLKQALISFQAKESELEPEIVPLGATIKLGMSGDRVIKLRDRLNYLGYGAGESDVYDAQMQDAVKTFQRTHLLEPDGAPGRKTITELNRSNEERIQQIQLNLERWRWMPETMGEHYIMVDIPGFSYSVIKNDVEVMSAKTVVGRDARRTPVFMAPMSYIVFSPYWHVPRSMAVKDFLPRLKKDPYALNRSKIRIFQNGQEIDPGTVDWSQYSSRNFPFQLRQDPGDQNSLGRVKFMFPNKHAIYLHDTPSKSLFNRTSRDFSSGCVRIENPEELAGYFLGEVGWDEKRISEAFRRSSEAHVSLAKDKKIPVYTLYMTVRVEGDSISFRADIYNKDKALIDAYRQLQ